MLVGIGREPRFGGQRIKCTHELHATYRVRMEIGEEMHWYATYVFGFVIHDRTIWSDGGIYVRKSSNGTLHGSILHRVVYIACTSYIYIYVYMPKRSQVTWSAR